MIPNGKPHEFPAKFVRFSWRVKAIWCGSAEPSTSWNSSSSKPVGKTKTWSFTWDSTWFYQENEEFAKLNKHQQTSLAKNLAIIEILQKIAIIELQEEGFKLRWFGYQDRYNRDPLFGSFWMVKSTSSYPLLLVDMYGQIGDRTCQQFGILYRDICIYIINAYRLRSK